MNTTSTRLRQLADRMGLDGFAEELREIAGELDANAAPAVPQGLPSSHEIEELADLLESTLLKLANREIKIGQFPIEPICKAASILQKLAHSMNATPAAPSQEPAVPQGATSLNLIAACQEVSTMAVYVGNGECSIPFSVMQRLDAALATAPSQPAVPQGWKLVPVEMTDEMRDAGNEFICNRYLLKSAYTAMLAATPAAPSQEPVPLTDRQFDLICQAIDKADTITMEGDYMLDSDDCIGVVRVMQALFSIAALREKEGK